MKCELCKKPKAEKYSRLDKKKVIQLMREMSFQTFIKSKVKLTKICITKMWLCEDCKNILNSEARI